MASHERIRSFTLPAAALVCVLPAALAKANHGPGTSGGGASTISGETLKEGMASLDFRFDYTNFRSVSETEAAAKAAQSGGFDSLDNAMVYTLSFSYGIMEDWQVGVQTGYYVGQHFISADPNEMGDIDVGTANPKGLMDTWFTTKYRVLKGAPGNLALVAGVKAPTGEHDDHLSNGELLEASSQPGTGAVDFQFGAAYSRYLTTNLTMDVSGLYTIRTQHDGFKVGDRADLGLALAYRLTDDIKELPNLSLFGEVLGVWIGKDHSSAEGNNPNSGGWTMYLSPGVRCRFTQRLSTTVAVLLPVLQDLNGSQVKQEFRITAGVTWTF
jgi:hypothetical protein